MRLFSALIGAAVFAAALVSSPVRAAETEEDLPPGAGRSETFMFCVACHGLELIKRQSQSRDGWDDLLKLMVTRHGMNALEPDEHKLILDYLAATFPVRSNPGGGWRNPFTN